MDEKQIEEMIQNGEIAIVTDLAEQDNLGEKND